MNIWLSIFEPINCIRYVVIGHVHEQLARLEIMYFIGRVYINHIKEYLAYLSNVIRFIYFQTIQF